MSGRLRAAVVALALVGLVAGGAAAGAQTTPTVQPGDATVAAGETATVEVSLSAAPDGLAGFNLTVEATDGNATVVGASVDDEFGITTARAEDGRATLEGVDLDETVQAGATDVRLGTVTVRGESAGETDLSTSVRRMDDDDGEAVAPATEPAALTVTPGAGNASNGSEAATGSAGTSSPTASADADGGDDGGTTPTERAGTADASDGDQSSSDDGAAADAGGLVALPSNAVAVALVAVLAVVSFLAGLAANRFR